jgi:hypothetical protein
MEEINALIKSVDLGIEGHGIFTYCLHLELQDGCGIGAGLTALDRPEKNKAGEHIGRFATEYGMQMIMNIMQTVGVKQWADLKGKYIRVRMEEHGPVREISNILKSEWLELSKREK